MTKKKILILGPLPPPAGGVATWTRAICKVGFSNYSIELVDTKILGKRKAFSKHRNIFSEIYRTFRIFVQTVFKLVIKKIDIVHINCSISGFAGLLRDLCYLFLCRLFCVPVIIQFHGTVYLHDKRIRRVIDSLVSYAKYTIVLNKISMMRLQNAFNEKYTNLNTVIMPLFVDDYFLSTPLAVDSFEKRKSFRFVFVGGITQQKGCIEILKLAHHFTNIQFDLIGWILPDMESNLLNATQNVTIVDHLNQEKLANHLIQSDCFLFPSYTEGFPLSLVEAMAIGLPVVATDVGAIAEMVDQNKGGFVVKLGDFEALKTACKNVIDMSQDARVNMARYNKNKVFENYRADIVLNRLENLYDQVTQSVITNQEYV